MQAQQAGDPKSAQQQQQQQHAYAATRQPVLELLGGSSPLAPASMHLPLLHYLIPLLDTPHMPFTRGDVQLLLRVLMRATSSSKAAVAQAVSQQQHQQQQVLSGTTVIKRCVSDVRLAVARSLARADVAEMSRAAVQAA